MQLDLYILSSSFLDCVPNCIGNRVFTGLQLNMLNLFKTSLASSLIRSTNWKMKMLCKSSKRRFNLQTHIKSSYYSMHVASRGNYIDSINCFLSSGSVIQVPFIIFLVESAIICSDQRIVPRENQRNFDYYDLSENVSTFECLLFTFLKKLDMEILLLSCVFHFCFKFSPNWLMKCHSFLFLFLYLFFFQIREENIPSYSNRVKLDRAYMQIMFVFIFEMSFKLYSRLYVIPNFFQGTITK